MSQLKHSEKELYRLINKNLFIKPIELSSFWISDRICVPVQNFIDMMQFIGIEISFENAEKLKQQLELISLQNVIENVSYWKSRQQDIGTYLSKKSPKKYEKDFQDEDSHLVSSHHSKTGINQNLNSILNRKFLALHAKKQLRDKMKLNRTLKNVKNQSNYQLSLKIGEVNDICSKLKNGTMYALQSHENGKIDILVHEKGEPEAKISQKKFHSQYQKHKLQIMSQSEETEGTLEDDLKKVLVEVMCLSSDMKKQIKLLQSKGISH